MTITEELCDAKHRPIGESLQHIRDTMDKVEARQWAVLISIRGCLAITLLNLSTGG